MERHLPRSGLLRVDEAECDESAETDPEGNLASSAVSGQAPPAGPQWVSALAPLEPHALAYDKPLCASLDGFTLHVPAAKCDRLIEQAQRISHTALGTLGERLQSIRLRLDLLCGADLL